MESNLTTVIFLKRVGSTMLTGAKVELVPFLKVTAKAPENGCLEHKYIVSFWVCQFSWVMLVSGSLYSGCIRFIPF